MRSMITSTVKHQLDERLYFKWAVVFVDLMKNCGDISQPLSVIAMPPLKVAIIGAGPVGR